MNNEEWFQADWIDNLKLRGGIGKTTSAVGAFNLNLMTISHADPCQPESMIYSSTLSNLSFMGQSNHLQCRCRFMAWRLLGVELDLFYKYQYDLWRVWAPILLPWWLLLQL